MAYIPLEEHLPGITGLLEYSKETAEPIRELTQILMRGPSTLSEGERELIATVVSAGNECVFCTTAHTAAANSYYTDPSVSELAKKDIESTPLSDKIKALLQIARLVGIGGKHVSEEAINRAKAHGATDLEIHDTVLIAALFCLYNRYVDGLATHLPSDASYYKELANRLNKNGYVRVPEAYEQLKQKKTKPTS
jgi:uncharacterized peroxidase-related enzyme